MTSAALGLLAWSCAAFVAIGGGDGFFDDGAHAGDNGFIHGELTLERENASRRCGNRPSLLGNLLSRTAVTYKVTTTRLCSVFQQ